ncbi:YwqG family protein [Wohlfahrtiimonas larvae]|uniref:YwqG family protein n=1 Tax=Wohlfahrtiimonas larvae TaxID=1157986 RepID=A0ABP9MKI8_9GAMM|nr:YwqG family protein [Wohlfahrtiimonas larvae]
MAYYALYLFEYELMMITEIQYPEALSQTLIDLLKKMEQLTISLSANESIDVESHIYSSKLCGVAYFPKEQEYPRNKDGQPLALIAQLNLDEIFADIEMLEACNTDNFLRHYPKTGMLSFFNDATDDLMGLEFKEPFSKTGYKVIYFPEVIQNDENIALAEFNELSAIVGDDCYGALSMGQSYLITSSLKYTIPSLEISTLNDENLLKFHDYTENQLDEESSEDVMEALYDQATEVCQGHAIGGYPMLTQFDPRGDNDDRTILLFQLDSVGDVMLGDCGSMQFFISEQDLKNRDFSNVLYDWACC